MRTPTARTSFPWVLQVLLLLPLHVVSAQALPPGVTRERVYPRQELPADQVARVNGVPITREALHQAMLEQAGLDVLRDLLKEQVIRQEAARLGVHFTAPELEQEVQLELGRVREAIRQQWAGSGVGLEQLLTLRGRTMEEFIEELRRKVEVNLLLEALVLLESLGTERVEIRLIQLRSREQADEIRHKLAEGADFGRLAALDSIHDSSEQQGLLPPFSRGLFREQYVAVEEAAFALQQPGEVSDVIRVLNEGNREEFFLLQMVRRHPARKGSFGEQREEILDRRRTRPPSEEEKDAWLGQQLDRATIVIDPK
jgi:hypothetical protein